MSNAPEHTFTVQYFKGTGKFYSEGTFALATLPVAGDGPYMYDAVNHIKKLRAAGEPLPGLSSSWKDGFIVVDHDQGFPILILPGD